MSGGRQGGEGHGSGTAVQAVLFVFPVNANLEDAAPKSPGKGAAAEQVERYGRLSLRGRAVSFTPLRPVVLRSQKGLAVALSKRVGGEDEKRENVRGVADDSKSKVGRSVFRVRVGVCRTS